MAYSRDKQIAAIVAHGEYHSLYQELRLQDREYHYRYAMMSNERFDHLFTLVETDITKRDTKFRKAIPARARLVITLQYLATGCSQETLSYAFCVGRSSAISAKFGICLMSLEP
eukprot:gene1158-526_t